MARIRAEDRAFSSLRGALVERAAGAAEALVEGPAEAAGAVAAMLRFLLVEASVSGVERDAEGAAGTATLLGPGWVVGFEVELAGPAASTTLLCDPAGSTTPTLRLELAGAAAPTLLSELADVATRFGGGAGMVDGASL